MQSGYITANDQKLYYEVHGEGEPLLIISGLAGDITGWAGQIEAWKQHFQVVAFDNRDAGRSSEAASSYTLMDMAHDALGVLDALEIDRAHVMGASMGSMIAQDLVLSHPDRVDKLVLVCTMAQMAHYRVSFVDPWRWLVQHDRKGEILPAYIITMCMTHDFQQDAAAVEDMMEMMRKAPYPQSPAAFVRQAEALSQHDALDHLEGIASPTLVIVGDQDLITPPWVGREVAGLIPDAEFQVLEGGGHTLFWEIPDRFNQVVVDFLRP